jgi:hypothetical protein
MMTGRMKARLEIHGDLVSFDATYSTNDVRTHFPALLVCCPTRLRCVCACHLAASSCCALGSHSRCAPSCMFLQRGFKLFMPVVYDSDNKIRTVGVGLSLSDKDPNAIAAMLESFRDLSPYWKRVPAFMTDQGATVCSAGQALRHD